MNAFVARPWRDPVVLGGLLALLFAPLLTWWSTVGPVSDYFAYSVPDGQRLYLLSKLIGLYAVIGFWLQASYGLLGAVWRRRLGIEWGLGFHRGLGLSVLAFAMAHAGLFIAASAARTNHFPVQFLLISFDLGFYRSMIAIGLIALLATALAVTAALARLRLGRCFRYAHWLALPAFLLAVFHSWRIGSETRSSPMSLVYLLMLLSLVALGVVRALPAKGRQNLDGTNIRGFEKTYVKQYPE